MKKHVCAALLVLLLALAGCASAQTLPGIDVFSPGLVRLAQMEAAGANIHAEAEIDIDKAMYARDLSVLSDMLSGTTIAYDYSSGDEALSIMRGGETLGVYTLEGSETLDALGNSLNGFAVLERVPLTSIAGWLEGLKKGDTLPGGFAVSEPFAIERTLSDDGARLTKISLSGAIARGGEAPYRVTGFLRQPAGRAPKDTFELTFTQDEDNTIELLYSALRENEVTRKNKEGVMSVRTTLKAAGKIAGYGVSSRLTVTMKNRWSADGEALSERVSISADLTHQDRTPGRRYRRLNDVVAETKHVIRLTTKEGEDAPIELRDEITLGVTLDSNTFLTAGADVRMCVGGGATLSTDADAIAEDSVRALAKSVYDQLDEDTLDEIKKGL